MNEYVELGQLIKPAKLQRAGNNKYPILSMTMHGGLVDQADKFKKRVASKDTSPYKVVKRDQLVVGFPIDEGVLSFQELYPEAIVSPAYDIWDIRKSQNVDNNYLERFLRSPRALSFYKSKLRSTTARRRTLPKDIFLSTEIPLPPLAEQKRIAAILDKADAIRRKRQTAIKLADDFLRATFLHMFGDPVTNPKGWEMKDLGELTKVQIGPFGTQLHKEDYIEGGIPLINPSHIINGQITPNNKLTITKHKYDDLPQYHLQFGDIIMGRRGEMGRCAVVSDQKKCLLCGTGSLFFRFDHNTINPLYLQTLLSGKAIKTHLERESLGATLPNLNKGIVSKIKIPIPSLKYQKKYFQIVKHFKKNTLSMSEDNNLFNSLSQRAFRGEL